MDLCNLGGILIRIPTDKPAGFQWFMQAILNEVDAL